MEIGLNAHRVNQSIVYSAMDTLKTHDPPFTQARKMKKT